MITVTGIVNLRNLPIMASSGFSLVFFYLLAALSFLIPSALACSELSSMLPQEGGVYLWGKEAFGEKTGFFSKPRILVNIRESTDSLSPQ